jgi:hypothetical protein
MTCFYSPLMPRNGAAFFTNLASQSTMAFSDEQYLHTDIFKVSGSDVKMLFS